MDPENTLRTVQALLANLPADEIDDDEPLNVGLDAAGNVGAIASAGAVYKHHDGATVRYRQVRGVEEVVAFRDGQVIDAHQIGLN